MIRDGRINAFKCGREWRFKKEDILNDEIVIGQSSPGGQLDAIIAENTGRKCVFLYFYRSKK